MSVKGRDTLNSVSTNFPAGYFALNYQLVVTGRVYGVYLAAASATADITVNPVLNSNVSDYLASGLSTALAESRLNELRAAVAEGRQLTPREQSELFNTERYLAETGVITSNKTKSNKVKSRSASQDEYSLYYEPVFVDPDEIEEKHQLKQEQNEGTMLDDEHNHIHTEQWFGRDMFYSADSHSTDAYASSSSQQIEYHAVTEGEDQVRAVGSIDQITTSFSDAPTSSRKKKKSSKKAKKEPKTQTEQLTDTVNSYLNEVMPSEMQSSRLNSDASHQRAAQKRLAHDNFVAMKVFLDTASAEEETDQFIVKMRQYVATYLRTNGSHQIPWQQTDPDTLAESIRFRTVCNVLGLNSDGTAMPLTARQLVMYGDMKSRMLTKIQTARRGARAIESGFEE
eukprot:gene30438-37653_t